MDLNQVTVPCVDYDESVRFYRQLGLKQIVDNPPRYARFETGPGATFSLHESDPPSGGDVVVYFEVDDVDRTVSTLEQAGIEFDQQPQDQSWLWREAYLTDPAGNRLCIYHAGENRRFPPWRIADGRERGE